MGTRNLTAVVSNGEYKIAQYGQWDGYPEGQGTTILTFLSQEGNIAKLKAALPKVRFLEPEGRDKAFADSYDKNAPKWSNEPDKRTREQKRWFETYISRDIGGEILEALAASNDHEIILRNSLDFAIESLMCEWAYVIYLDKGTFEVYTGFNKEPLDSSERFASLPLPDDSHGYYQVRHAATFHIDSLPSSEDFLTALHHPDDEDA